MNHQKRVTFGRLCDEFLRRTCDQILFFIDNKEVAAQNLESELLVVMQGVAEPTIVVRAENTLTIQDLVDVLQTGAKLKIKMVLATKQPSA